MHIISLQISLSQTNCLLIFKKRENNNDNGCPPTDYNKRHYLVNETVKHLTERYGIAEVKSRYFEVWNEPNLGSFFRGTQEEYFRLYEISVDVVKSVCSDYRVGGPSTRGQISERI